jgi:single-stranded-DNA-specific exonuclease
MSVKTQWIQRKSKHSHLSVSENESLINQMIKDFKLTKRTAEILISRGMTSIEETRRYLNPSLADLHDPFLFNEMEKVVNRIAKAKAANEKICLYGDYDADGTVF